MVATKQHPLGRKFAGKKGFIDEVLAVSKTWGRRYYVNFLSENGLLLDGHKLPESCLVTDNSFPLVEAKRLYDEVVTAIVEEGCCRSNKWDQVAEHLSKKHNLETRTVSEIYTSLRDFESYYERWIEE